jgi:hypothetical protein
MTKNVETQPKKRLERTIIAKSKWITMFKDRVLSNGGNELEYWCVDRSDSVIIIVRQGNTFVLTPAQYRPGIDQQTLDFPGGRIDNSVDPMIAAAHTVRRELQLEDTVDLQLQPLATGPMFVDSAFSNQKVYGFTVDLPEAVVIEADCYSTEQLLEKLHCLQCRCMLLEWIRTAPI